jgi:hypothetical protein
MPYILNHLRINCNVLCSQVRYSRNGNDAFLLSSLVSYFNSLNICDVILVSARYIHNVEASNMTTLNNRYFQILMHYDRMLYLSGYHSCFLFRRSRVQLLAKPQLS